ncbi:MAG: glycosyltransferase family 4 protein [Halobacteriales archaeon]
MQALNYLELSDKLDRSGIGTAARHQKKALADTDVDVLTSPWVGDSPASAVSSLLRGNGAVKSYDLAHLNVIGPGSLAIARHAKYREIPLILHAHVTREDFAESFRFSSTVAGPLGRYLRWFYSHADLVLVPSEYTMEVLEDYPVRAPIETISNGVDLESIAGYERFRDRYRERYDFEGMVVFAVGNVFERKGLSTFGRLAQRTDYDFAWFGHYDTGPHASRVVKRWTTDPPSNLTFTGWIDDIRGAYGAGDVYLFPTKNENQGIAVLEAMAARKAVVLRDIPVFEEFFTHGEDCLKASTIDEFEAALRRLDANPELRERLGENARATAEEHSLDRLGSRLASIYHRILEEV